MKSRPVGTKLFHADGQTDRHDNDNSLFRNFAKTPKDAFSGTNNVKNYYNGTFLAIQ